MKKNNMSRENMEEIRAASGLEKTKLTYRGEEIDPSNYVQLEKYDNKIHIKDKVSSFWNDTYDGDVVAWVNGEIFISPYDEDANLVNKKVDSNTKFYFENYKKKKADDIIILKSDRYGNLITKEQEAYDELLSGIKYLSLNKAQYCEILAIVSNKLKNMVDGEVLKDKYSSTIDDILALSPEDLKKVADNPGVKKMLEETSEEYKKEYASIADE